MLLRRSSAASGMLCVIPVTPSSLQGGAHGWRACVHTRPAGVAPPTVGRHQLNTARQTSTDLLTVSSARLECDCPRLECTPESTDLSVERDAPPGLTAEEARAKACSFVKESKVKTRVDFLEAVRWRYTTDGDASR